MASDKVARILRAKSPFNAEQIAAMSDVEGWAWIYGNATSSKVSGPQVCFTGFNVTDKDELSRRAGEAGLTVVSSITKGLSFLCAGDNAGPAKIARAREQGTRLLTREEFLRLLDTGEVPT